MKSINSVVCVEYVGEDDAGHEQVGDQQLPAEARMDGDAGHDLGGRVQKVKRRIHPEPFVRGVGGEEERRVVAQVNHHLA